MPRRTLLTTLLFCCLLSSGAAAHPFDTYGFGSRLIGMGGGGTAAATDVDAAYYNPAAAVRCKGFVTNISFLVADDFLEINGQSSDIATVGMIQAGLAVPLPLGEVMKDRLFFSAVVGLPYDSLFDMNQPDDEALTFPFWNSRNRRVVLEGALAARVTDWLAIGVGASMLPDVYGTVRADLLSSNGDNSTRIEVRYDFNVTAGLLVEPLPWLAFGVSYRGAHHTRVDIPVDVDVADALPEVKVKVVAPAFAVPHEVAFGVQAKVPGDVTLSADVTWYDYSALRYSSPTVAVLDSEGEVVSESRPSTQRLDDVFAVRAGAEWRALPWLLVRGGYGYIPTPFRKQDGLTNLLDADRNVISLGVGFDLRGESLWTGISRLAIDLHAQVSLLRERAFEKTEFLPDNPGYPTVALSGGTFSAGLSARFWFGGGTK